MKRRLTPAEKKRLAYAKDHVELSGESRHGFRRKWPKKKAIAHRLERRTAEAEVRASVVHDTEESLLLNAKRGKGRPRKWGVVSLGEYVSNRHDHRVARAGDRVRRRNPRLGYHVRALLAVAPSSSAEVRRAAVALRSFLRATPSRRKVVNHSLYCVFRDAPQLERRVQAWLATYRTRPKPRARAGDQSVEADEGS